MSCPPRYHSTEAELCQFHLFSFTVIPPKVSHVAHCGLTEINLVLANPVFGFESEKYQLLAATSFNLLFHDLISRLRLAMSFSFKVAVGGYDFSSRARLPN